MKKLSTALVAASMLALGACGGGGDAAANNSVEDVNVAADDLTLTDNGVGADAVGNDLNAVGGDVGNAANAVDANVTDAGNAAANAAANVQ